MIVYRHSEIGKQTNCEEFLESLISRWFPHISLSKKRKITRALEDCFEIEENEDKISDCVFKEGFHTVISDLLEANTLEDLNSFLQDLEKQIYYEEGDSQDYSIIE